MKKDIIKELNVEKLNICEPDGQVKMTLFNSKNIPSLIIENEDILPGHRKDDGISGAMFYNNQGDECGGFIYGSQVDDMGNVSMGMSLTFDQYKQDQVLQLLLQQEGDKKQYGFMMYDRPDKNIKDQVGLIEEINTTKDKVRQKKLYKEYIKGNAKRLFVGKDADGLFKFQMFDKQGKEKLKLFIDENDSPVFESDGKKISIDQILELIK